MSKMFRAEVHNLVVVDASSGKYTFSVSVDDEEISKDMLKSINENKTPVINFELVAEKEFVDIKHKKEDIHRVRWVDGTGRDVEWEYEFYVFYPNIGKKGRYRFVRYVKDEYMENVLDKATDNVVFVGEPVSKTDSEYLDYLKEHDIKE